MSVLSSECIQKDPLWLTEQEPSNQRAASS